MKFWNQLSYRHKNLALIGVFLILAWVVWQRSLSGTFRIYGEYQNRLVELEQAENIESRLVGLEARSKKVEALLNGRESAARVQHQLLDSIGQRCRKAGMVLQEVQEPHIFRDEGFGIHTNVFEVKGGFQDALKMAYDLETGFEAARLVSLNFETRKNRKTGKKQLYAKLYLQNLEKS